MQLVGSKCASYKIAVVATENRGKAVKKRAFLVSSLGLIPATFSPVLAADNLPGTPATDPVVAQAPVPAAAFAFTWTGFYIGVHAGGVQHSTRGEGFLPDTPAISEHCWDFDCGFKQTDDATGVLGGAQAGYNLQFDTLVVGAEVDFSGAWARKDRTRFLDSIIGRSETGLDALGTARFRLGYTFGGAMAFVTGGAALGHVRSRFQAQDGPPYSWSDQSGWRVGYTGGGGLELAAAGMWSIKAEGLYYKFPGKKKHVSENGDTFGIEETTSGIVGRLGLNYRF
jgi:outer membrane immunogenic protein